MNIKDMTIEQLKAIKCDHYENIQRSQQTLSVIQQELELRAAKAKEESELKLVKNEVA